jgi:hypothetical protein
MSFSNSNTAIVQRNDATRCVVFGDESVMAVFKFLGSLHDADSVRCLSWYPVSESVCRWNASEAEPEGKRIASLFGAVVRLLYCNSKTKASIPLSDCL